MPGDVATARVTQIWSLWASHQQPAPINYPFGCIWKHRDGALCWHSYDDIMGTLGIMVWLGDSDTLTMCNTSPHQVKFQRSYVTNDVRSAISWCYTSACVSVARGECKQIICCFIIRDWICGCWLWADWHQPAAALAHTFSHRENPHCTLQLQTICPYWQVSLCPERSLLGPSPCWKPPLTHN